MVVPRLLSFALLACAAFAWVPPGIDRLGLAALGLAFGLIAAGRVAVVARPVSLPPLAPPEGDPELDDDAIAAGVLDRIAGYGTQRPARATAAGDPATL